LASAIHIGSYYKMRVKAPLQYMLKKDILEYGEKLDVPYELTYSCYKGEELHCGECPTCKARRKAFIEADIEDPTEYQK
jgi:7-cyano-7-deazaguanine synthase